MKYELNTEQVLFIGAAVTFTIRNVESLTPDEKQAAYEIMDKFFEMPNFVAKP